METRDILITGGLGFVGSNLAISLADDGHNVDILDLSKTKRNILGYDPTIRNIIHGDISDINVWDSLPIDTYDVIYHLAANTSHIKAEADPYIDMRANIQGTINLCEAVKNLDPKPRIIYACSRSVYGYTPIDELPIDETHATNPLDSYGISKLAAEKYLFKYSYHHDIPLISFRMANQVGPRQGLHTRSYQMISWIFRQVSLDEIVGFWGDGLQTRDFCYVGDTVRIYKTAGLEDKVWTDYPIAEVLNLPGGEYSTWLKAIQTCGKALKKEPKIQFQQYPNKTRIKLENEHSRLSSTKIMRRIGDTPRTPLVAAFQHMDWYYQNRWDEYLHEGVL